MGVILKLLAFGKRNSFRLGACVAVLMLVGSYSNIRMLQDAAEVSSKLPAQPAPQTSDVAQKYAATQRAAVAEGQSASSTVGVNGDATMAGGAVPSSISVEQAVATLVTAKLDLVAGKLTRTIRTGAGAKTVLKAKLLAKLTEAEAFAPHQTREQWCKAILASPHENRWHAGQFVQDHVLWASVFGMEQDFVRRTFVDLASNEWKSLSNTFFFEACLGWSGVCIEPDPDLAQDLRDHRQCSVVQTCITERAREVVFSSSSHRGKSDRGTAHIETATTKHANDVSMKCLSLGDVIAQQREVLKQSGGSGSVHIDFLSLDIEGFEAGALRGVDWNATQIDVVLVEDKLAGLVLGGRPASPVAHLLQAVGFKHAMQVAEDHVYVHAKAPASFLVGVNKYLQHITNPCISRGQPVCSPICTCGGSANAPVDGSGVGTAVPAVPVSSGGW